MTTVELDHRRFAAAVAVSMGIHALALILTHVDASERALPEPPVLVFEMVETASVTAAPPAPVAPPPSPPVAQPPPEPVPEPAPKAAPRPKPLPKAPPAAMPAPERKPAQAPPPPAGGVASSSPSPGPVPPIAGATRTAAAAKARYEDVLYSWLVRHKEYPLLASRRGLEGRPVVTVRVDRKGHVLSSRISSPSRHAILDEAAVAMVRRADPFPPVPDDVAGDSYEFIAPVEFRLR